jgi:hypothetical protein
VNDGWTINTRKDMSSGSHEMMNHILCPCTLKPD